MRKSPVPEAKIQLLKEAQYRTERSLTHFVNLPFVAGHGAGGGVKLCSAIPTSGTLIVAAAAKSIDRSVHEVSPKKVVMTATAMLKI